MDNLQQEVLSPEEASLLEIFEQLTAAQKTRIAAIVTERAEGKSTREEFLVQLRQLPAEQLA